ncbi:MAG: hypothetical protein JJE35_01350, partial [Thermoleophilia bacterium]|nr:hypothetical protein [Thermoleophilia bacterium]
MPAFVALLPCVVLLFFGADMLHVLVDNAFTVDLALACGIGALAAFERDDRRGRLAACGLLCLGILTYTVALAFLVAVAVAILLGDDRRRRIWVAAIPAALYLAWWVWARQLDIDSDSTASAGNALLVPAWSFQSLSLRGRPLPRGLCAVAAVPLTLWVLGALTANEFRSPDNARYLMPGAIAVLLVAAEAAHGVRWSRGPLLALLALAVAGLGTNAYLLDQASGDLRNRFAVQERAATRPYFEVPTVGAESIILGGQSPLAFPFEQIAESGRSPVEAYREVAERYGSLGFSPAQIEAQSEGVRAQADAVLVAALGLATAPGAPAAAAGGCSV